jgi:hypothetical protein
MTSGDLRHTVFSAGVASLLGLCCMTPTALLIGFGSWNGPPRTRSLVAAAAVLGVITGGLAGVVSGFFVSQRFSWLGFRAGVGSQAAAWLVFGLGLGHLIIVLIVSVLGALVFAVAPWDRRRQIASINER